MTQTEILQNQGEALSPRLKWMLRKGIQCEHNARANMLRDPEPWEAWVGDRESALDAALFAMENLDEDPCRHPLFCSGETPDAALCNLARENGWKLWNEE